MRALIIGGNGFIGRNLAVKLHNSGWSVDCIDNLSTSTEVKDKSAYQFFWIEDWIDTDLSGLADYDYDRVYYLASYPSPKSYKIHQLETLKLGYTGVEKAISLAITCKATLFLASSSETYGNTTEQMIEGKNYGSVNTFGERSCYDESKRVMETLAYIYKDLCDIKIGRIFNTYGPGMAMDGRVFTNFLKQGHNGEDITIYRDSKVTRSPCYIDDLLNEIEVLISSNCKDPCNIGNDKEYTLGEIAEFCREVTGYKSRLTIIDNGTDKDDPTVRRPVLNKIRQLGYNTNSQVDLKTGLKRLYDYMIKENLI